MTARVQTDGPFADISFLDDTGANVMSLYELPDLALLGVDNGSSLWGPNAIIATAGGAVIRRTLWVRIKWFCSPVRTLGDQWILQRVSLSPG
jgi:hypothetical protein